MKFKFLIVFVLFYLSVDAKIYGPKRYDSIGLLTFVSTDFYTTTENFNSNSKATGLISKGSYMLVDIPVGIRYGITNTWSFEAELKASYAKSESSDFLTGGERTNSEIHESRFSTDMLIETSGFDLIPEFEIIIPFKKIDKSTDSVMLGEGVQSLIGRLHLQTEFSVMDFFSHIGYQKRDSGRSDLFPWSVGLGWNHNGSLLGARVFGFQSMSDDTDKSSPLARQTLSRKVNGGSFKVYGVSPSVISTEALWFLKFQKQWQLQFNAGLDLAGQSYSKGIFGGITLILDWGQKQRTLRQRPRPDVRKTQPLNYDEGVTITPNDTPEIDFKEDVETIQGQEYFVPVQPRPVRPVQKPRTPVGPSDQQIRNQMDDAEMQIELKRKKKRR